MTELLAGFALGIAGSVHCVGMCGPLMLALRPVQTPGRAALYHAARVTVYAGAGLIAGAIGHTSHLLGIGRVLSIGAGVWLLVLAARRAGLAIGITTPGSASSGRARSGGGRSGGARSGGAASDGRWLGVWLARAMAAWRQHAGTRPVVGTMVAGALNALLPCGLVYAAFTAATALGTATGAVGFMLAFGLGTVPALATMAVLARAAPLAVRARIRFLTPIALALVGALLVARGTWLSHMHAHDVPSDQQSTQMHMH